MSVRFTILGEIGLHTAEEVEMRSKLGLKLRALLAALLVRPGSAVTTNELVDWVWADDDEPPRNPLQTLYLYSSRVRQHVERFTADVKLCVRNGNFRLDVDPLSIDYFLFQDELRRARAHSRRGDHHRALETLNGAFTLWHPRPLADLHSDAAERWRLYALENVLLPAYDTLFAEQLVLGESDAVLAKLDLLAVDYRSHLTLFKRRLEALHAQALQDDATRQFLVVHKALSDDLNEAAARDLREFHDRLRQSGPTRRRRGTSAACSRRTSCRTTSPDSSATPACWRSSTR